MTTKAVAVTPRNVYATRSLIVGILTFIPGFILSFLGSLIGLVAFGLGVVALIQISKDRTRGQGAAIAGIVLGAIGACLAPYFTLALMTFLGPAISNIFSSIYSSLLTATP